MLALPLSPQFLIKPSGESKMTILVSKGRNAHLEVHDERILDRIGEYFSSKLCCRELRALSPFFGAPVPSEREMIQWTKEFHIQCFAYPNGSTISLHIFCRSQTAPTHHSRSLLSPG